MDMSPKTESYTGTEGELLPVYEKAWEEAERLGINVQRIFVLVEGPWLESVYTGFVTRGNSTAVARLLREAADKIEAERLGDPPMPHRFPGLGPTDPEPQRPGGRTEDG